jgi:O-antigen ligase
MIGLGLAAVIMGGNRSSFLGAAAAVVAIALVRRRFLGVTAAIIGIVACLAVFRYVGENFAFREGAGAWRVLSLVSPRVAELTGARDTVVWRQKRWERAMLDVYRRPWIGHGYGGLARAFLYANRADYEASRVEIDVVSGTVHNGFIAGARALGVPAAGLFLVIFFSRMFSNARLALRLRGSDPERSDLHTVAFAHLAASTPWLYFGTDLNTPLVWFYLILGVLVEQLKAREADEPAAPTSSPVLIAPRPAAA